MNNRSKSSDKSTQTAPQDRPPSGRALHGEAGSATTNTPWTGAPARRAGSSEAELGRARETGLNTDSRGGPGSAARAGARETDSAPESGLNDAPSTEPRERTPHNTRIAKHSSQGLAGAQGSGGGAERGPKSPRR